VTAILAGLVLVASLCRVLVTALVPAFASEFSLRFSDPIHLDRFFNIHIYLCGWNVGTETVSVLLENLVWIVRHFCVLAPAMVTGLCTPFTDCIFYSIFLCG
jgi:hypothetical protein